MIQCMDCNLEFDIYYWTVTVNDSVMNKRCLTESNNLVALLVKLQRKSLRRRQTK